MKVGFIGAGTVTGTFGRHLMTAGHTLVVSNSRGPETLAGFVADLGPGAIAGTKQQAAECHRALQNQPAVGASKPASQLVSVRIPFG